MRLTPILIATLLLAGCGGRTPVYKDPGRSAEERADDLLKRMTVDEKLGQLLCPLGWPMYDKVSADSVVISDRYREFIGEQHGGMLWAVFRADPWTKKTLETGLNPTLAAKAYNALQRYAMDSTRLGIPIILAEEAPHGHMAIGTTVFPTSIGLASTWDTDLVETVGRTIGTELQAQGATIGYGPVIDLSREPRWSRVEETYGEDVHLTSQMASAMVRGTSFRGVISTLKHFVAYGVPEGGHNGNPSIIGMRDLRENVLPTFKAAIDAGALSVMTSYNSLDGIPTTCNPELLTGVLRDEWGFNGFVVSDLESIDGLARDHRVAASTQEAGELSLNAGVDVDLGANCFSQLKESVEKGRVSMKTLDRAVKRVLLRKFEAGLYDHPYVDESAAAGLVRTPEHLEVAAQAAREGVVLLKNDGILPLKRGTRIALIGPNADNQYNQLGDYTAPQAEENVVTMLDGLRAKGADVLYVKGCAVRDTRDSQIAQAAIAAMLSDVAVVVVGGSSARDFRTKYIDTGAAVVDEDAVSDMEAGEGFDRASLELLGLQNELLKAVRAAGKPVVVVYVEGRPLDKNWAAERADALLTMWYPGGEGGTALADVLFGDYNPAGRLPVSVPRNVGQIPVYYNKKNPRGHDYVEMSADPLYPFGYGLSYTTFEYSDLTVSGRVPDVEVTVRVKNTGVRDGDEVVQLYVIDPLASTVRPRKQLRAFDRVFVKAGETVPVTLKLGPDAFSLVDAAGKTVIERGDFILEVGASSEDIRLKETITY
ncbi:MAG: glycoside hydrolase family 3 C-terminal domain-containing protein [Bacteroidales bacterium]|nr:glycoside hydrolase family 3 C-terminal domain-containing protein [Bacteroidales bacterium]